MVDESETISPSIFNLNDAGGIFLVSTDGDANFPLSPASFAGGIDLEFDSANLIVPEGGTAAIPPLPTEVRQGSLVVQAPLQGESPVWEDVAAAAIKCAEFVEPE